MIRFNKTTISYIQKNLKQILQASTTLAQQHVDTQKRFQSSIPDEISLKLNKNLKLCPENGYVNTSPYGTITVPDETLDKYVWKYFKKWSNKNAAVCVVTGRKYTFSQLRDASAAFAIRLQKHFKLKSRDVIAVCLPNLPEYPIAVFGAHEAGLTVTPVNPIYTAEEIARQITVTDAKIVICIPPTYEAVKNACTEAKKQIPILCIPFLGDKTPNPNGTINFFEMISTNNVDFGSLENPNTTPDDLAFLPFSSGTTGLPKAVMLTHRNIVSNCEMVQVKVPTEPFVLETTDMFQDIIPCFLPFFHIYGLTVCMISKLHLGCELVTMPKFTPDDLMKSLIQYKSTILNLVPPVLIMMNHSPNFKREHAKYLRYVMTGAAPIGGLDAEKFLDKFPNVRLAQGYGLTETSPVVILTPSNNQKYSSAGFLVPETEAKLVEFNDITHKGVGPKQSGELCVRGMQVMKGYLNNPEANDETFLPNGWMRTGDIAHYDEEGYFYITDRMKELIKVKGFQVPPAELEEILRSHPKIIDAAVFGVPHEKSGEVPRAVVVAKPNENVREQEVLSFVAEKVAPYKQLVGGIQFVKEIPKNQAGKILRRELKKQFSS